MIVSIIPARGGSKGIPKKNIMNFCGKPLIAWSIEQSLNCPSIDEVYISTDCEEIANVAQKYQAKVIIRPTEISGDQASSESAWIHALDQIEKKFKVDLAVGMQATSPLRTSQDLEQAISLFYKNDFDSLFSGATIADFCIWKSSEGRLESFNYDYKNRKRRQDIDQQYVENGSFYLFKPEQLRKEQNRLAGKIGVSLMEFWKTFEIDDLDDVKLCELIMNNYLL